MVPEAIVLALQLLGVSSTSVQVVVVTDLPSRTTGQQLRAWVDRRDQRDIIYVSGESQVFRRAAAGKHDGVMELAGVLAHERCHLGQSLAYIVQDPQAADGDCYDVQLAVLDRLGASRRAKQVVREARAVVTGR